MDALSSLAQGFATMGSPTLLLACLLGVLVGTIVGLLPGLGSVGGMAVLLPFVFTLDTLPALIILMGIIFGANYGNSTAAILLNIPGDPAAAATAIDGHAMANAGRPGPALAVAALSSTVGSLLAIVGVATLSVALTPLALRFGQVEFFALALLGLAIVASLSSGSALKAYAMAALGLVLTLPGSDPVSGTPRFIFGQVELISGLGLVPIAMGVFAIGEILYTMQTPSLAAKITRLGKLMPSPQELRWAAWPTLRGSILGFFIGVLPGAGSAPAAFAAYGLEAKVGKRRRLLGTGVVEGVAAPESANNSASAGSFVPLFTLAIPGSAPTAVVLGALIVLGVRPGPLFLVEQQDLFWSLIAAMFIATVMLLILNLPLVGIWASVLRTPYPLLTTALLVLTTAGVFSINNSLFDVWVTIVLGVAGYFLRRSGYPLAPLILGFVLGTLLEQSFRQGLLLSGGSLIAFVASPVAATLLTLNFVIVAGPFIVRLVRRAPAMPARDEAN